MVDNMIAPNYMLGRLHAPDARDLRMTPLLEGVKWPKLTRKHWTTGPVLDQGQTNSCVGHGWKQFLMTTPIKTMDGPSAIEIYNQAKLVDEFPDNDYQDLGTSVRGGAKAVQNEGRLKSYVFASNIDEVTLWVLTRGPVVIGSEWYQQMFYPDPTGAVQIAGPVVGGHCYLLYGVDHANDEADFINSWGTAWGNQGKFKMKLSQLAFLLNNQGEACTAVEKKLV